MKNRLGEGLSAKEWILRKRELHEYIKGNMERDGMFTYSLIRSDQISRSVVSDYLQPHESRHARPNMLLWHNIFFKVKVLVAQSCPTLCNHMDCGPPGSSVHGIFQARILEWIAISFSRGSSQARDQTQVSCIASRVFTVWLGQTLAIRKNPQSIKPSVYLKSPNFHSDKTSGITHFSTFIYSWETEAPRKGMMAEELHLLISSPKWFSFRWSGHLGKDHDLKDAKKLFRAPNILSFAG